MYMFNEELVGEVYRYRDSTKVDVLTSKNLE